jgi:hypothetical protein
MTLQPNPSEFPYIRGEKNVFQFLSVWMADMTIHCALGIIIFLSLRCIQRETKCSACCQVR